MSEVLPSSDYIPSPEGPPSPNYVPGPEEPEQAPPSPIYIPFVPEPVYLEFLPVDDEVFPAEEQPMPAADSQEDLEEDDEEDPKEDPADYPANRGDRDDEESSDDDDDAEEEHLAPADPAARDALPVHETEMPEMCLPLRKRPCRTTPGPGCEVGESSAAGAARQFGPTIAEADLYGFTDM
ncbi:hypothetical protein Tco_1261795 [Tanacetum coccineum]